MNEEVWKDIEGYEGLYQVSNLGRVKSLEKKITHWNRFKYCTRVQKERILKQITEKDGYLVVNLYKNGKRKWLRVHRLVAETFIPNLLNLPVVNHKDLNKQNNCVANLEWCTDMQNKKHAQLNGHIRKGKPVAKYDLGGNLIEIYENLRDFSRKENIEYAKARNRIYSKYRKDKFILKYYDNN